MSNKYVHIGLATGNNDGSSQENAWQTEAAWSAATNGSVAAGDIIYWRGNSSRTSAITLATWEGTNLAPVQVIACDSSWNPLPRGQYVTIDGAGSGANIDGWILNGRDYIVFQGFEIKNFTRDGIRGATAVNTNITFKSCSIHNNTVNGINGTVSGGQLTLFIKLIDCYVYSNGANGLTASVNGSYSIRRCRFSSNITCGISHGTTGTPMFVMECIFDNNGTGILVGVGSLSIIKNCIFDRNATGISFTAAGSLRQNVVQCRVTNNTTGISVGNNLALETTQCAFYGNGTRVGLGTGSICDEADNVNMSGDGYVNGLIGNYTLNNGATPAECRWTQSNIGDNANTLYWSAGVTPNPDFPTSSNVRETDTTDGVAGAILQSSIRAAAGGDLPENRISPNAVVPGSQNLPALNHVSPNDTLEGVQGTQDLPALNYVSPNDTLEGVQGTQDLPSIDNVMDNDTLEGVTGNKNHLEIWTTSQLNLEVSSAITNTRAEYTNPDQSKIPTEATGGPSPWLYANVLKEGTLDLFEWESLRNTALAIYYKLNESFKKLGLTLVGELASDTVPAPTAPIITLTAVSNTSIKVDYTGGLYVEYIRAFYKKVADAEYTQFPGNFTVGPITLTGLLTNNEYNVKLIAYNDSGNATSNIATKRTLNTTTDLETRRAIIIQWIEQVTGYTDKVFWSKQNMPRLSKPYVTADMSVFKTKGREFISSPDSNGVADISTNKEFTLSINCFGTSSVDPMERMMALQDSLNKIKYTELFKSANIAFIDILMGPVDTTIKLDTEYERRASMDLLCRMPWVIEDDEQGLITLVDNVEGTFKDADNSTIETVIFDIPKP